MICAICGVPAARARGGRLVHTESIPKNFSPHEAVAGDRVAYESALDEALSLGLAARSMLQHHDALHPGDGCEWAERLEAALRASGSLG